MAASNIDWLMREYLNERYPNRIVTWETKLESKGPKPSIKKYASYSYQPRATKYYRLLFIEDGKIIAKGKNTFIAQQRDSIDFGDLGKQLASIEEVKDVD